jgi:Raf kinase inhibitor-like YbhB/YbcL family protein
MRRTARMAGLWLATAALAAIHLPAAQPPAAGETGAMAKFTLTSSDFTDGGTIAAAQVFNGFDCKGGNVSPALKWSGAPEGTRSFALLVHDPDAPTGSGWWHWIVYNIPAGTTSVPAGAGDPRKNLMPAGAVQARSDYGTVGYGGPCPPPGKPHHYHFRLYALKVANLEVPADASAALIGFNVRAQELGHAELMGLYGR